MYKDNLNAFPSLKLSFNDLAALRGIIRAYITYTRRATRPTPQRDEQLQTLEHLYVRLASLPTNITDIAILLSTPEVAALDAAIAGFCAFVRSKVPASRERDETLRDVERMRGTLAHML